MRYFIFTTIFASVLISISACGSNESANSNANQTTVSNANVSENSTNTETVAKKTDEPVPTFTDAAIALAEGNKYLDASENEKAIEAYKQAVALNPDLADAHFQLGVAYGLVEKQEEVVEDKLPGEEDETASKKGKKQVKEKKTNSDVSFENAIKVYKKIVAKNPKDDAAFYNLGRAFNKLDDDKEAQKALQSAVKLKPENGEYQTEYGTILIKLAQYDEAIRALKKAVEVDEANLRAAEMLEQAEAGKKRVDFGANQIKSKLPPQEEQRESRSTSRKSKETEKIEVAEPPKPKSTP